LVAGLFYIPENPQVILPVSLVEASASVAQVVRGAREFAPDDAWSPWPQLAAAEDS
jgi:hypothetical protein